MICGSGHPSPGFEFILSRLASLTYSLDSSVLCYPPFWIKPWLFSRTFECTSRSRLRAPHSRANLHREIHKRGHDEDYRLYADYHVPRENRGSSFRIFHEWHYRDTQLRWKQEKDKSKRQQQNLTFLKIIRMQVDSIYLLCTIIFFFFFCYTISYSEFWEVICKEVIIRFFRLTRFNYGLFVEIIPHMVDL